jgi:non-ribosomal peptide synthetase-like protein
MHEVFAQTVAEAGDQLALDIPPGNRRSTRLCWTYKELDARALELSACLGGRCAGREGRAGAELVAILLPRHSPDLFAAQLAVLQCGLAYTCLDVSFPDGRVAEVLTEAAPGVVVTDAEGAARLSRLGVAAGAILDVGLAGREGEGMAVAPAVGAGELAYVIYTSGTTGRPKGVMIDHASLLNLVLGDRQEFSLGPGDRVAQGSSAAYDSSVEEVWLAFASGAALVVLDDDSSRLGPDLVAWLAHERITVFCPPPTLLRATGCEDPASALPLLRLLYVGGEALPADVAERWAPGRRLVNGYGPTECTVTCLRGDVVAGGAITIGRPVPGVQAWVLDSDLQPVPVGEQGELCIGGVALARGYRNQPEITGRAFVAHPTLGRIYRTGDCVHCDARGDFFYHGRLDAQVKLRGYRIELGAIESRLADCPGVRAAACAVQGTADHPMLVALVIPDSMERPPDVGGLRAALGLVLPDYMVPARIGFAGSLPTTVGGKLHRAGLPRLDGPSESSAGSKVQARSPIEARLVEAFRKVLRLAEPCCVTEDFFKDLGGDSLSAAMLVTQLRGHPESAWITVRDIYEARSVEQLALRAPTVRGPEETASQGAGGRRAGRPLLATMLQGAWLLLLAAVFSWGGSLGLWKLLPWSEETIEPVFLVLVLPWLGFGLLSAYAPLALAFAVGVKWLLIGRYTPKRVPVWGGWFLRNWIVQSVVRGVPWRWLAGTHFHVLGLRALGAKIGRRVHIHRGVSLNQGGWDLLEIGDDVTVSQDAALRIAEFEEGHLVFGPVTLRDGVTLDIRSGVAGHTVLGRGAYLAPLSSLSEGACIPDGERWDGIPARPAGTAPPSPPVTADGREWSPAAHGVLLMGARALLAQWLALPIQCMLLAFCLAWGLTGAEALRWVGDPVLYWRWWVVGAVFAVAAVPFTLGMAAAACRLMGRVPEGVISRWSLAYVRVWLKSGLVEGAGEWLSGTLFWPAWLRCAGMRVGSGCELSTILDVVPEHIEIGRETFFADGVYLGGPRLHRGSVTLARTTLGRNTFVGNHAVIPSGVHLPEDVLFGVCTVADDRSVRPGSSWFGHPPFELPRREIVLCDRALTHEPSPVRYGNRAFWELLRFTLPAAPFCASGLWIAGVMHMAAPGMGFARGMLSATGVSLGVALGMCVQVIVLKWLLLGSVRPGQHPLWCCWCSRWDYLYVVWGKHARPILAHLEGTLLLGWFLRGMGMKLGRRVVLGPGFAQVVDPDMIHIEDDATVNAMFQAHTFEDRVLKIDHVIIRKGASVGSGAVPLYGADIGEGTRVTSHSVIMKRERLLPGLHYAGAPTRLRAQ